MIRFRLDPPLSRGEWFIAAIFALIGFYAGHAYGHWLWGQIL